jgi:hypothetical protein
MEVLSLVAEGTQSFSLMVFGGVLVFGGGLTGLGYVVFGAMCVGGFLGTFKVGYKSYKLWSERPREIKS